MSYATKDILAKLENYCAYQERCHADVSKKLWSLKIPQSGHDEIILHLISNNYLNEERFAKAFARGKFRIKKWGKLKISLELKSRQISDYCIGKGMEEIDAEEYYQTCKELYEKKYATLKDSKTYIKHQKTVKFLISKGYESNMVWEISKSQESD
jgi:regulatory protein